MQRFIFAKRYRRWLALFVLLCLTLKMTNQTYCSAFCTYFNEGSVYAPMCTGAGSGDCTKCDDTFFTLANTTCQPHGYFNESLQFTDLTAPIGLTLPSWMNISNLFRINIQSGVYEMVEFYTGSVAGVGGNDKIYRQFTNLPAHFSVRLRFFVLRSTGSPSLNYYIANKKYHYDYNQFPSNVTLGDIITTEKIFHQERNLTVEFEGQLVGLNQFIGVKELMIFVSKCSENCQLCNSSQNCAKCQPMGNGSKTYLHDGYCFMECPQTKFQNDTLHTCDRCQAECQNCLFNSSFCTQCKSEGRFQTFLYNNTCHYSCPDGYFKNFDTNECSCPIDGFFVNSNHTCQTCASECNSCFGPERNMCYNCSGGNYLVYGTSECSKLCPAGQYGDGFARECYLCSPFCSECEGTASKCKACFLRLAVRYLYEEECVMECPRGYGRNFNLRRCQICPPYYYSYRGECLLECPQMYVANNESKSCLYLGETNYLVYPKVVGISLLPDGKALSFQVSFSEGLAQSSRNWISLQAYYSISLKMGTSITLPKSVSLQNDYIISLVFAFTEKLSQNSQLQIEFSNHMNTTKNINYARTTTKFRVSDYPAFLKEYFRDGFKSFFNVIIIPLILTLAVLIGFRLRGTYDLFIETIRLYQFAGLAIFLDYPLQGAMYSLLQGFNYFNLEFFPNIYNWFVPSFYNSLENQLLAGFTFLYGDMDFIRMIGSILVFIALWIVVVLLLKYFVVKNIQILGWCLRLGMDLVEVKILHAFWNSLIFTFINSQNQNIYMLWVHLVSYIFMALIVFRYYKIYQSNSLINFPFIWRIISTLFISVSIFNKMILMIFLTLISVGFGFRHYYQTREQNQQLQSFKFGWAFLMRDSLISLLPWLSVMAICMITFYKDQMTSISVIITLGIFTYVLTVVEVVIFMLIRSFMRRKLKTGARNNPKQNQDGEYNKVEQHGTLPNVSESFAEDHESYIKDEFVADFENAHKQTIADQENRNRDNNDSKIRTTIERTLIGSSSATKVDVPTERAENNDLKIESKVESQKKLYPAASKRSQLGSEHDEELFESKAKRANRTEMLKRKQGKVQPLQTITYRKESETDFEHITLKKVQEDQKQEEKTQFREKQHDRERINVTEMLKKPITKIVKDEINRSSPRLNPKATHASRQKQQSRNSKISSVDQNIFVNQDDY